MRTSPLAAAVGAAILLSAPALAGQAASGPAPSFARQIRPILELRCYECHDENERESELVLTTVKGLLTGGKKAGPAIVAGLPGASPILEYLSGARHPRMPKSRRPLPDDQIALIARWIAAGAADDSATAGAVSADARDARDVPALLPSHTSAADLDAMLTEALFSNDEEALFVLRRNTRIDRLPRVPDPAPAYPGSDNPIDQFIAARWRDAHLPAASSPPPVVDDAGYIKRVTLDLVGTLPTPEEVAAFAADRSAGKRTVLVDRLLARTDDYAANWTPFWEEALGSQTTRLQGGIPTRGNYRDWIFRQFADDTPYDVFAASLIDPVMPRHKPRVEVDANGKKSIVGYILNDTHTDTIQSAANVAQVFLGTSMKCASCHNHFLNDEWPQTRFLAFAGLFAGHDLEVIRCERRTGQMVPAKFPFALPEVPGTAPATLDGRLHRAALLLTDPTNPRFARSIVNRLWRRYVGLGFVEPADDFRIDRTPSHPALLAWLADDFMRHGYDLKHTIRLMLTSRTYQHRYDPSLEDRFDVQKPDEPRYFRSPRLRRLTAEEFIDSVRLVANGSLDRRERVYLQRESTALTRALGRPASRNEISTSRSEDAAVLQALELMNGPELSYLVYGSPLVTRLAADLASPVASRRKAVPARLYQAVYGRAPDARELAALDQFFGRSTPSGAARPSSPAADQADHAVFSGALPAGATTNGSSGAASWVWADGTDGPPGGGRVHASAGDRDVTSHAVTGLPGLTLAPRDWLGAWVRLDPEHPPTEITIEWMTGDGEHRAYWADAEPNARAGDAPERRWLGRLPAAGRWTRLEVPAGEVDVTGDTAVTGWSFGETGGRAFWSGAWVRRAAATREQTAVGDALWALLVAPEFQFIQ